MYWVRMSRARRWVPPAAGRTSNKSGVPSTSLRIVRATLASLRGLTLRSYRSFVNASPTTTSGTAILVPRWRAARTWCVAQAWCRSPRLTAAMSTLLSASTVSAVHRSINGCGQVRWTLDGAEVLQKGVALSRFGRQAKRNQMDDQTALGCATCLREFSEAEVGRT